MTGPGSGRPGGTRGAGAAPARSRRGWALSVVAAVAGTVLVVPYLTFDAGDSRLDVGGDLHYGVVVGHVLTAFVALVLGPLQFVPAIRTRRRVHRALGRTYLLAGVLPAALTGIPAALLSGRVLTQVGLTIPAVGWLVTGWLAYRAARGGDFESHRRWMTRNYALTFLAVTARAVVPLLLIAGAPFRDTEAGGPAADTVTDVIPVGQVLGWIVNLAVAELLIRRRRARAPAAPAGGTRVRAGREYREHRE
ncbi:hypothetical protein DMB38_32400 [Streptomyces sp. WAC 06738]|uniref:DUF2306 domain-containing protein n=1 Tax=Streptomyces sp. WAC 06738 TaxID=2203210 RepID=UPI000F708D25|nr:DUF2306 domain-containing protein [Streptomyces sp. WAC 06738]AZM49861.1 hypothetical protein DMB38_32400 [Streptomyces sp. WAC 06738]